MQTIINEKNRTDKYLKIEILIYTPPPSSPHIIPPIKKRRKQMKLSDLQSNHYNKQGQQMKQTIDRYTAIPQSAETKKPKKTGTYFKDQ